MHIVRPSNRYSGARVNEVGEISAALKGLAKELDVPVIALAQLSRALESRDDKRPTMADLRDSGSIEQDADAIIFVYREAYYLERETAPTADREAVRIDRLIDAKDQLEAIVAKQRNGPTGTVKLSGLRNQITKCCIFGKMESLGLMRASRLHGREK
jgi:replicative DNA helicase